MTARAAVVLQAEYTDAGEVRLTKPLLCSALHCSTQFWCTIYEGARTAFCFTV